MSPGNLNHTDVHLLRAAQGWLELGDHRSAAEELGKVSSQAQDDPMVLMLRWHVQAKGEDWAACVELGRIITTVVPDNPFGWVNLCNAIYFCGRPQEAYDTLFPVLPKFPDNAMMPYNLACYACQLGRLDEARGWLAKAFKMKHAGNLRQKAREDPDLKPLRDAGGWP